MNTVSSRTDIDHVGTLRIMGRPLDRGRDGFDSARKGARSIARHFLTGPFRRILDARADGLFVRTCREKVSAVRCKALTRPTFGTNWLGGPSKKKGILHAAGNRSDSACHAAAMALAVLPCRCRVILHLYDLCALLEALAELARDASANDRKKKLESRLLRSKAGEVTLELVSCRTASAE